MEKRSVYTKYYIVPTGEGKPLVVDSSLPKALNLGREVYGDDFIIRVFRRGRLNTFYDTYKVIDSSGCDKT